MTLLQCKDKVAQRMGFGTWKRLEQFVKPTSAIVDEVATLYAIEKVKEALQLAAERVCTFDDGHDLDGNAVQSIDYTMFTALETELIENIKNEK